jgi:hypothetical protein
LNPFRTASLAAPGLTAMPFGWTRRIEPQLRNLLALTLAESDAATPAGLLAFEAARAVPPSADTLSTTLSIPALAIRVLLRCAMW